jgi:hypothetical protein
MRLSATTKNEPIMNRTSTGARKNALHRVEIAIPCTASWDAMQGNDRVRHCGDCNKSVFNLSAMPEAEAAELVAGNSDGRLCVRFYRRQDGTVMTSDCGARTLPAQPDRSWGKLPGMAGLALAALSASGCAPVHAPQIAENVVVVDIQPGQPVMMGEPVIPQPEPVMLMGAPVATQADVQPAPVAPVAVIEPVTEVQAIAPLLIPPPPEDDSAE